MLSSFPFFSIFLINLFWIIYLIPGFALYKVFCFGMKNQYFAKKVVFSFFLSTILLLPLAIIAPLLTININIGIFYFLVLLGCASFYLLKYGKYSFKIPGLFKKIRKSVTPWAAMIFTAFSLDFFVSTLARGFVVSGGDVWTHISKINNDIHHGISAFDPYFLENGRRVVQSTHPSNMVHIMLALAGGIIHISALDVWAYSISFFRIIAFLTVYVLAKELTKNKYLASLITFLFYLSQLKGEALLTILYPANQAFFTSIFLLTTVVILLKESFQNKFFYLVYASSIVLVAYTHQIQYGLIAMFLGGFYLILLLSKEINLKKFVGLLIPFLLGLPIAFYTLHETKFITDTIKNMNSNLLHYFGRGFYALSFPENSISIATVLILVGLILAAKIIKDSFSRTLLYYAVIFNIILLYTPFFMIPNKLIPIWGIQRYEYLNNLFVTILIALPLWLLIQLIFERENKKANQMFLIIAVLALVAAPYQGVSKNVASWGKKNYKSYETAKEFAALSPYMKGGSTVMANKGISFSEPAIADCYIVGIDSTRTTNSIPTKERETDTDNFYNLEKTNLGYQKEIIKKYNIAYLIVMDGDVFKIEPTSLGFKKVASIKDYSLYEKTTP